MSRIVLPLLIGTWLATAGAGVYWLMRFESTPGQSTTTEVRWPSGSAIARDEARPTLLVFAHPHCPCTRATLGELSLLMAHCPGRMRAYVVFTKPPGVADDWEQTDLWHTASAIPGVQCLVDCDDREATRFAVTHSGHALVYDRHGKLQFSGGITRSRGHAGDNPGRSAIEAIVATGKSDAHSTPVYGCPLRLEDSEPSTSAERD